MKHWGPKKLFWTWAVANHRAVNLNGMSLRLCRESIYTKSPTLSVAGRLRLASTYPGGLEKLPRGRQQPNDASSYGWQSQLTIYNAGGLAYVLRLTNPHNQSA